MVPSQSPFNLDWLLWCDQQYLNEVGFPRAEQRKALESVLRLILEERREQRRASSPAWRLIRRTQRRAAGARSASLHAIANLLTRTAERLRRWAATQPAPQS